MFNGLPQGGSISLKYIGMKGAHFQNTFEYFEYEMTLFLFYSFAEVHISADASPHVLDQGDFQGRHNRSTAVRFASLGVMNEPWSKTKKRN